MTLFISAMRPFDNEARVWSGEFDTKTEMRESRVLLKVGPNFSP